MKFQGSNQAQIRPVEFQESNRAGIRLVKFQESNRAGIRLTKIIKHIKQSNQPSKKTWIDIITQWIKTINASYFVDTAFGSAV
jgi:hypothetical protein